MSLVELHGELLKLGAICKGISSFPEKGDLIEYEIFGQFVYLKYYAEYYAENFPNDAIEDILSQLKKKMN